MKLDYIITERLILIPVTFDIVMDLLSDGVKEIEKLGIKTNGRWPRQDTRDILPIIKSGFDENKEASGFEFWIIVKKENMDIIGDIGFKGKPNSAGEIEVGYGLIEEARGKAYALEALKAMLEWAFSNEDVKKVKADCLIDNHPSIKTLQRAGMREINRDSELIYWEIENTCNY